MFSFIMYLKKGYLFSKKKKKEVWFEYALIAERSQEAF